MRNRDVEILSSYSTELILSSYHLTNTELNINL